MGELEEKLFRIAQLGLVAVEGLEHLELVQLRQDFQQAPQLFRADVVVAAIFDQLDDVFVGTVGK